MRRAESGVVDQQSNYARGVILGLTMAEAMMLLVFCLLIALATLVARERQKSAQLERQLAALSAYAGQSEQQREVAVRLADLAGANEPLPEVWRRLVEADRQVQALAQPGQSRAIVERGLAAVAQDVRQSRAEFNEATWRRLVEADQTLGQLERAGLNRAQLQDSNNAARVAETLKGSQRPHAWPPIISLRDAEGFTFEVGSAILSPTFEARLRSETIPQLRAIAAAHDVNVIEVVGHTDEQPIFNRRSNLDATLVRVLRDAAPAAALVPSDNAGLGLARAVSVLRTLRSEVSADPLLSAFRIIPLSGAQLVENGEQLSTGRNAGDDRRRRRIEIRLRRAEPN